MSVVVVGAGVVGLACAYELAQDGHQVHVLQAGELNVGASWGNAAKIATAEATPVPAPGMVLQGLRWMTKPDSPLYVKPSLSPRFVSFMVRMARACTEAQFRRGLEVHLQMAATCVDVLDEWTAAGLSFEMHERGVLLAYADQPELLARQGVQDVFDRYGATCQLLDADGAHEVEPALSDRVTAGLFYPADRQIAPGTLTAALAKASRELGVTIQEHTSVTGFERRGETVTGVVTDHGRVPCDHVVLAAGVWTRELAQQLGHRLPIEPGKGYSVDYHPAPVELRTSLTLVDQHVAVTPLDGMVRVAGTMEFAGMDPQVRPRRVQAIKDAAAWGFRDWDPQASHAEPWAGFRPMTPDGLPIVGPLGETNVQVASGHGMLGLTLAPSTARTVRDVLRGDTSTVLRDASPDRFARPSRRR